MSQYVAGYVRVSTPQQSERSSVINQEIALRDYAKRKSADVRIYRDIGVSAKSQDRPEFQRLLSHIRQGKIHTVAVTKLDRITRRLKDLIELQEMLEHYEIEFIAITQNIDTRSPAGRFMFHSLGSIAQLEREITAERVAENMRARAHRKKWNGGVIPFGYTTRQRVIDEWFTKRAILELSNRDERSDLVSIADMKQRLKSTPRTVAEAETNANRITPVPKTLVIDVHEAPIIRKIYDIFLKTGSFRHVVHEINRQGYRTRSKKYWPSQTVKRILQNPIYCGTLTYNKRRTSGKTSKPRPISEHIYAEKAVDPIISKQIYDKAQKLKANRHQHQNRGGSIRYPLTGLLRCSRCGSKMYAVTYRTNRDISTTYSYYRCNGHVSKGTSYCTGMSIARSKLESFVENTLRNFALNPAKLESLVNTQLMAQKKNSGCQREHHKKVRAKMESLDQKRSRLIELYEDGLIDKAQFKKRDSTFASERQRLKRELPVADAERHTSQENPDAKTIARQFKDINDIYQGLEVIEQQVLLRTVFDSVIIDDHDITFRIYNNMPSFVNGDCMDRGSSPRPA